MEAKRRREEMMEWQCRRVARRSGGGVWQAAPVASCSAALNKRNKFLPHKHFWKPNNKKKIIVQESWLLIKGSAKVLFYDLDDKFLTSRILKPGEVSITFAGGHKLDILKNDTIIYEHKNGPYEGQQKDLKYLK